MVRLDRTNAGPGWRAWHALQCREPVLTFADDETHQYGEPRVVLGPDGLPARVIEVRRQAKCIRILPAQRLVLINPVDDEDVDAAMCIATGEAWLRRKGEPAPDEIKLDIEFPSGLELIRPAWWHRWFPWLRRS